jgi:YgiT-type zinc finger domain-containing protein
MICHNCGGSLKNLMTNLPFKLSNDCIVIIKGLPVLQCQTCYEYVVEDEIMGKVDNILSKIDTTTELEILSYAG